MLISKFKFLIIAIVATVVCIILVSLSMLPGEKFQPRESISIGLIETDSEDSWRMEMIAQIKRAANVADINVMTIETDRTQSAQINAIRSFIVYGVDVIVFSPVMNNGWDYVLKEAADAQIPIITVNEKVNTEVDGMITCVTYDYKSIGAAVTDAFLETAREHGIDKSELKILELRGAIGSTVSEEISEGIRMALENSGGYKINYSANADYMRSRAKEMVNGLLRNEYEMDIIITHNDGMALGVIDALEKNGLRPGIDVQIVTFGGGADAQEMFDAGKISYMAKCDLEGLGKKVVEIAMELKNGGMVSDTTYLNSSLMLNEAK